MIANDTFSAIFGAVPAGDAEVLAKVAKAATGSGFAVVVNEPGSKKPLCTLTARDAKRTDQAAQDAARDRGDVNWTRRRHVCGISHALTDPAVAERTVTRMVKAHGHVNLGIEVGRSRVLVVDVDTAEQKHAFLAVWSDATGQDMSELAPTVISPGKMLISADGDEVWVHKDGGHYYFGLPDDVDLAGLPGSGILTGPEGWVAIFRDKQVIVPPSVRAEGAYQLVGQVYPPQLWLLDRIRMIAESHVERRRLQRDRMRSDVDPIDEWSRATPWADLLGPDGWTDTGLPDSCDCPVWTRPGDASTPKSATAHSIGCVLDTYDVALGHGPIHLWTDNPPEFLRVAGRKTFSKLQYVALRDHAGDAGEAMKSLGLAPSREPRAFDDLWAGTDISTVPQDQESLGDTRPATLGNRIEDSVSGLAESEHLYPGLDVDQPSLFAGSLDDPAVASSDPFGGASHPRTADLASLVQPAQPVVEASEAAGPSDDPDDPDIDAEQPAQPVVYPPELVDIARAAIDSHLPADLVAKIRHHAESDWAREETRRLRNRGQVADIRSRLRSSVDRLSEIPDDDEVDLWRVDELWQQGQVVMLTAQYKAGKTTMVTNLVRSLVDGVPFLDRFGTTAVAGSVFIVNAEMTRRQFRRWLRESPISAEGRERVYALHVREAGPAAGDILDPTRRDELCALLREVGAQVLVMDPLNPLISSAGLDEDRSTDVARWFTALADVQERTYVEDVFLVHHFGHNGQRGRGSSKFMDAPDVLWTYTIEGEDDDQSDADDPLGQVQPAAAPRFLAARGRDVEMPRTAVEFDRETRTLRLAHGTAGPSRRAAEEQRRAQRLGVLVRRVVFAVNEYPGMNGRGLQIRLGGNKDDNQAARDEAVRTKQIRAIPGARRAILYYPADPLSPVSPTVPDCPPGTPE